MPHEIIMPALGMAQKTGLIVAWHKAPGDAVKASEILLDVETDKTTMEVEAGHDGFVAALMAEAGDDVPVGSTIAIISSDKPDPTAPAKASPAIAVPSAAPAPMPAVEVARPAPAAQPVVEKQPLPKAAGAGRILASPKTRRLAAERGIDLGRLVALGLKQPFHAADLDALPLQAAAPAAAIPSEIEAMVDAVGLAGMLRLLREEADGTGSSALLAAFAASSLRAADGGCGEVAVRVEQGGKVAHYRDPDRCRCPASAVAGRYRGGHRRARLHRHMPRRDAAVGGACTRPGPGGRRRQYEPALHLRFAAAGARCRGGFRYRFRRAAGRSAAPASLRRIPMSSYTGPVDLHIGGRWLPASGGERFDVINPADEAVLASVASATEADARAAVDAAVSLRKLGRAPPRVSGPRSCAAVFDLKSAPLRISPV